MHHLTKKFSHIFANLIGFGFAYVQLKDASSMELATVPRSNKFYHCPIPLLKSANLLYDWLIQTISLQIIAIGKGFYLIKLNLKFSNQTTQLVFIMNCGNFHCTFVVSFLPLCLWHFFDSLD